MKKNDLLEKKHQKKLKYPVERNHPGEKNGPLERIDQIVLNEMTDLIGR
jgi:hypothetical protein